MVLFSFISTILYFDTRLYYDVTMQDINNCLGYSILVGSTYNMIRVEPLFRFSYFQVVTSIMI